MKRCPQPYFSILSWSEIHYYSFESPHVPWRKLDAFRKDYRLQTISSSEGVSLVPTIYALGAIILHISKIRVACLHVDVKDKNLSYREMIYVVESFTQIEP